MLNRVFDIAATGFLPVFTSVGIVTGIFAILPLLIGG